MNVIELNGDNFLEQITKYDYFSESIPKCFSTEDFSIHSKEMLSVLSDKCISQPTNLSIYKSDVSRRVLSIPNPESFLKLCGYMKEEWKNIKRLCIKIIGITPSMIPPISVRLQMTKSL